MNQDALQNHSTLHEPWCIVEYIMHLGSMNHGALHEPWRTLEPWRTPPKFTRTYLLMCIMTQEPRCTPSRSCVTPESLCTLHGSQMPSEPPHTHLLHHVMTLKPLHLWAICGTWGSLIAPMGSLRYAVRILLLILLQMYQIT